MDEKTYKALEFDKIREMLKQRCICAMGKEQAQRLVPFTDIERINKEQDDTAAAVSLILRKGSLPLGGVRDIREAVKRALVMGSLNIDEFFALADFLYVCAKVINYGNADESVLKPLFDSVTPLKELESEITRCIAPPDEIKDSASHTLAAVRKAIHIANARVREHLNGIIHSQQYKTMLQDNIITLRGDRFCVPVKQEFAKAFPGVAHDQSATGQTVFMEPLSVVTLNNQIKEKHAEEKAEIERILRELTALTAQNADALTVNLNALAELDFIFAKGELALSQNAMRPLFNSEGQIDIVKGRHPLLNKDTVVPTNIQLGRDYTLLLITGPNTGGKTVALKTLGLFTLMGQAGLHIGAKDGSKLAVFDGVFADIGDEQSIEQSLSTFSAHISNIISILKKITPSSLVLLDELGAGTDPTEGAALAIAILSHIKAYGARAAVTTHYSELKVYALSTEGVENACCEFDISSLSPTYKLLIGIPGKSNAFEISKRLGLPDDIIQNAKAVLSKEDARFEDIITDLEISKKTAETEKERAEALRLEAEQLKKQFEADKQKILAEKQKIIAEAKEDAKRVYAEARSQADALVAEFKKTLKEGKQHEINEVRAKLTKKAYESDEPAIITKGDSYDKTGRTPKAGERVIIAGLNKQAVVTKPPDSSGNTEVAVGSLKMKTHISQLSEDLTKIDVKPIITRHTSSAKHIKPEIDLRGCTGAEAIEQCEKYIDEAYLANLNSVRIIHGKGTFALMKAVNAYLKTHPRVKSTRQGEFGEGDSGVTIAELKT